MKQPPRYVQLHRSGDLGRRKEILSSRLHSCTICPHQCGIDRYTGARGRCRTGSRVVVSSYCSHFGEEPLLTGTNGVGNIFFGNCNLRCVYCQNHQISQNPEGEAGYGIETERLAEIMLELQEEQSCHLIGLVSPSHVVPQIVEALERAIPRGFRTPLIYNTNCYDDTGVLRLLDGIIDIYLPDVKYSDDRDGRTFSGVSDYVRRSRAALREMYRQTGPGLVVGEDGVAIRGLIVRHLILPNGLAGTRDTLAFIGGELSPDVSVSIMAQYYPAHRVAGEQGERKSDFNLLSRPIRPSEYEKALHYLEHFGFSRGWIQEPESAGYYQPDFGRRKDPFRDREDFRSTDSIFNNEGDRT